MKCKADFATKFDQIMTTLELSNVRIASLLHVDPSLISLYRSGSRSPAEGSGFVEALVTQLARLAIERGQALQIGEHMLLQADEAASEAELASRLMHWFGDAGAVIESQTAQRFFDRLENCRELPPLPESLQQAVRAMPTVTRRHIRYVGFKGLQEAARDFLLQCTLQTEPSTLRLYSDHSMEWMTSDPEYRQTWGLLMQMVLQLGHRIEIIHHFDRGRGGLFAALEAWMPLYMTGQIRSWSYAGSIDKRFHNTRFILPGVCCVHGTSIAGDDANAVFHYTSSRAQVAHFEHEFALLVEHASPLLNLQQLHSPADIARFTPLLPPPNPHTQHFHSSLPLACLAPEMLDEVLERSAIAAPQRELAQALRALARQRFEADLAHGTREGCIVIPEIEQIVAGQARLDLPIGPLSLLYGRGVPRPSARRHARD